MRKSGLLLGIAGLFFLLFGVGQSTVINVPSEQPTIQAGIDAAIDWDTVLVADGVYTERITFLGKAIIVASEYINDQDSSHILNTVIDADTLIIGHPADDTCNVVRFVNGEDTTSILQGFTLRNNLGIDPLESNALIYHSCPQVSNCIIESINMTNDISEYSCGYFFQCDIGSIHGWNDAIYCTNCLINGNINNWRRGLISLDSCSVFGSIDYLWPEGNAIINNSYIHGSFSSHGDGDYYIYSTNSIFQSVSTNSFGELTNCTIHERVNSGYDAMVYYNNCIINEVWSIGHTECNGCLLEKVVYSGLGTDLNNCTILGTINTEDVLRVSNSIIYTPNDTAIKCTEHSEIIKISCTDIYGFSQDSWLVGNCNTSMFDFDTSNVFFYDPRFCDTANSDYTLAANSPCLPENNKCDSLLGAFIAGCDAIVRNWYVSVNGNDSLGDGSQSNPYAAIQHAIYNAADGDTVFVSDGQYYERISFLGKAIVVASEYILDADSAHIVNTIIDADTSVIGPPVDDSGSVVIFVNNEDKLSILQGFTIQNGIGVNGLGGGVYCYESDPLIINCIIKNNEAIEGGGIFCNQSYIRMLNCDINNNSANRAGCIMGHLYESGFSMKDCILLHNTSPSDGQIACRGNIVLNNCSIINTDSGGIYIGYCKDSDSLQKDPKAVDVYIFNSNIDNNPIEVTLESDWSITIENSKLINSGYTSVTDGNTIEFIGDTLINSDIYGPHDSNIDVVDCVLIGSNLSFFGCLFNGTDSYIDGAMTAWSSSINIMNSSILHGVRNSDGPISITNSFIGDSLLCLGEDGQRLNATYSTINGYISCVSKTYFVFENCLVTTNGDPIFKNVTIEDSIGLVCCDLYGFTDEWLAGDSPAVLDTTNVYFLDPMYCDTSSGDYTFKDISPCAPDNNDCDMLIGAYDIGCNDAVPEITSETEISVYEDSLLVYRAMYNDEDGPDTIITYENVPSWLNADADSLYGVPTEGMGDTSVVLIVSDGYKADTADISITIIPVNDVPVLDSIFAQSVYEGNHLEFTIHASDIDSDNINLYADYMPENAGFADSGNGTGLFTFDPNINQGGVYSVLFFVSDGELSDSQIVEISVLEGDAKIVNLAIGGQVDSLHVLNHTPTIYWSYTDPLDLKAQTRFEIAVGIDDDWQYAEMWNPAPFETIDTFVTYNGISLDDGDTYYLRLRVNNSILWSEWYEISFRMNSVPSIPMALQPIDEDVCVTNQPTLSLTNSFDAEGDTLVYDYMAVVDTAFGEPELYQGEDIPEGEDSTGWQINESLHENWRYWWRARAFDGYEYSDWSESEMFWINAVEEAPDTFRVYYPPDTSSGIVYDMLPDFIWSGSHDNDPFDSVHYSLYLSTDSEFVFFNQIDSIWESFYTLTDSLYFGTKFYWKMKAIDNAGQFTYSNNVLSFRTWKLGDANDDWEVNLLDILALIDCLYGEGNCPEPVIASDVNGDCNVNLLDVLYLISYLYGNPPGAAPVVGCE